MGLSPSLAVEPPIKPQCGQTTGKFHGGFVQVQSKNSAHSTHAGAGIRPQKVHKIALSADFEIQEMSPRCIVLPPILVILPTPSFRQAHHFANQRQPPPGPPAPRLGRQERKEKERLEKERQAEEAKAQEKAEREREAKALEAEQLAREREDRRRQDRARAGDRPPAPEVSAWWPSQG